MLSTYFRAVARVLVMIFLASYVACPPSPTSPSPPPVNSAGESKCREQINFIFSGHKDGYDCLKKAFLELLNDDQEWALYEAARLYYEELIKGIRPGQIKFPGEYCYANYNVQTANPEKSSSSKPKKKMKLTAVDNCYSVLKKFFSRMRKQEIVEHVYRNETNKRMHYIRSSDRSVFISNVNFPDIVIGYVKHVERDSGYVGRPVSPIEFCAKNVALWENFQFATYDPNVDYNPGTTSAN